MVQVKFFSEVINMKDYFKQYISQVDGMSVNLKLVNSKNLLLSAIFFIF